MRQGLIKGDARVDVNCLAYHNITALPWLSLRGQDEHAALRRKSYAQRRLFPSGERLWGGQAPVETHIDSPLTQLSRQGDSTRTKNITFVPEKKTHTNAGLPSWRSISCARSNIHEQPTTDT